MKKNTMMRIASVLMVAVLLSTCAISSTFAKYVSSASAGDTARIAKWGVEVTATGNAFKVEYQKQTDNNSYSVVSKDKDSTDETAIKNILAPGTSGNIPETKKIVIGHFLQTAQILEDNTTINVARNVANSAVAYGSTRQ